MTIANLSALSAQIVTQSAASGKGVVSALTAQVVQKNIPQRYLVSAMFNQVVQRNTPNRYLIASMFNQVLIQNAADAGGIFRVSEQLPQVVFTTGANDQPRQRAWTFDFDGHVFYCLDLGESGCLMFDTITGSWSKWTTNGYSGHFNFKNGFHWRAGKKVVGGGLFNGELYELDPAKDIDEGFKPIQYEIQGVIFTSSESVMRQYNLRMVGSPGRTKLVDEFDPPSLKMVYSDDNGATWSVERSVILSSTDKDERIEFRSLGRMKQPGRIFRLYDDGGIKFIAYVMADVEGE